MRLPGEPDRGELRLGFAATEPAGAGPEVRSLAAMGKQGGPHIFEHGEFWKDIGALERAPQSHAADLVRRDASDVAPVDEHASRGRSQIACDQAEQRRFAGAVWPDHRCDLAFGHGEVDVGDRAETGERFGEASHFKHRRALLFCGEAMLRRWSGRRRFRRGRRTARREEWRRARTASIRCRR